jgi:hypothetical protein
MTYKKGDYARYHKTKKAKQARAMRNKARRKALRDGRVSKGDGTAVHHKIRTKNGGASASQIRKAKTKVVRKSTNTAISNRQRGRKKK